MRKTCSKALRAAFLETYPWLDERPAYWELVRVRCFGRRHPDTLKPMISERVLAKAEGKQAQLKGRNYKGYDLLAEMKERSGGDFAFSNWLPPRREQGHLVVKQGRCRELRWQLSPRLEALLEQERYNTDPLRERVYMVTGKRFSEKQERVQRYLLQQQSLVPDPLAEPEAEALRRYMNALPVNRFAAVLKANFNAAMATAVDLPDQVTREAAVEVLMTIRETLQPFYGTSEDQQTVRLFPINESIPMLPSLVRKALCKGWTEFDLASSQLAICAYLWDCVPVQRFLANGNHYWTALFQHYGLDYDQMKANDPVTHQAIKGPLKDMTYALAYGMSRANVVSYLDEQLQGYITNPGKQFLTHPLIKATYNARQQRAKEILLQGAATTCFGRRLDVLTYHDQRSSYSPKTKSARARADRRLHNNVPSIMAQQAQAIELQLLLPVLELAQSTKDWAMTLWQHDGFSVEFARDREGYTRQIQRVVEQQAQDMGICTSLDVDVL